MMAAAGMPMEEDADTKRLRKQEAKLKLEYRRAKEELMEGRTPKAAPAPAPDTDAGRPSTPPPAPVAKGRKGPDERPVPQPRPFTSKAGEKFLERRSTRTSFTIPATATAPAKTIGVAMPASGGVVEPEPDAEPDSEREPEIDSEAEFAADLAESAQPTAYAATNGSRTAVAKERQDRERIKRRAHSEKGTQGRSPQPPMSGLDASIRALGIASGHESGKDRYPDGSGPVLRSFPPRSRGAQASSTAPKWPATRPAGRSGGQYRGGSRRIEALRGPGNLPTTVAVGVASGVMGGFAKTKSTAGAGGHKNGDVLLHFSYALSSRVHVDPKGTDSAPGLQRNSPGTGTPQGETF